MNCQAKIIDKFGGKYTCLEEATSKITIITKVPHLNGKIKTTVKCLCGKHASRTKQKYIYKIKHLKKNTVITEENL